MRKQISETTAFKNMENFQQNIILKKESVKNITDSLIQIKVIGFDRWKEISNSSEREIKIIEEIQKNTL